MYVNLSINESNFANMTFILFNTTGLVNSTTTYSIQNTINWTNLIDNIYYYNVSIYDSASRFNFTPTYTIILDRTSPGVILSTPLNNTNTTDPSQNLTVNITDNVSGIKNASLYIFNSSNILINQTNRTVSGLDVTFGIIYNFLYDGIFKWFYRVTDYSNNINTTVNYTLTLDRN